MLPNPTNAHLDHSDLSHTVQPVQLTQNRGKLPEWKKPCWSKRKISVDQENLEKKLDLKNEKYAFAKNKNDRWAMANIAVEFCTSSGWSERYSRAKYEVVWYDETGWYMVVDGWVIIIWWWMGGLLLYGGGWVGYADSGLNLSLTGCAAWQHPTKSWS